MRKNPTFKETMLLCIIPIEADRFLFLKASYFMDPGYYAS
jgi:hypothetical protein